MMALLVLLFVSLALMQTALVSIESNMKNVLRNEAVSIAEARIAQARGSAGSATSFDALLSDDTPTDVDKRNNTTDCPSGPSEFMTVFGTNGVLYKRSLKNIADFRYCTNMTVTPLGVEDKEVVVTVAWLWKGETYSHTNSTVLRRP
jgi:hypothetical protein